MLAKPSLGTVHMTFDPDDDPSIEITATSMLMCVNARYGCQMMFTYQPGQRDRAVDAKKLHETVCAFRFHTRHETNPA